MRIRLSYHFVFKKNKILGKILESINVGFAQFLTLNHTISSLAFGHILNVALISDRLSV